MGQGEGEEDGGARTPDTSTRDQRMVVQTRLQLRVQGGGGDHSAASPSLGLNGKGCDETPSQRESAESRARDIALRHPPSKGEGRSPPQPQVKRLSPVGGGEG